jgi:polar amino acid transport system substrate-binding protein
MRTFWFFAGVTVLALVAQLCGAAAACEMRMRWSEDPPFSFKGHDGRLIGIDIEIAEVALQRLGCRLLPVEMPFGRGLRELEQGRLDMAASVFRRAERERYAHYARPVLQSRNLLFVHRSALERFKAGSLRDWFEQGGRLGVQPGVNYGPEFTELAKEPRFRKQLELAARRRSLWLMLERQRIDGLIVDELTAGYELRHFQLRDSLRAAPLQIRGEASHMVFSKRSVAADFVARYDRALAEMSKDGSLSAILLRYGQP